MSEKITVKPEQHEALPSPEQHELLTAKASPEKSAHGEKAVTAHEARAAVAEAQAEEQQPRPLEGLSQAENAPQTHSHMFIDRQLRNVTRSRSLHKLWRQESLPVRTFSKVVHQPAVQAVSEGASKTISRPSGMLGGGLVALLGTSIYLYLAHHMGFTYNSGVFLILFAGGFVLGLLLEFLVYLATRSRRKLN